MRFLPVAALVAIVWWTPPMRLNLKAICAIHISHYRTKVSLKMAIFGGFVQKSAVPGAADSDRDAPSTTTDSLSVSTAFERAGQKR